MSDPSLSNPIYVPRLKTVVLSLAMNIDPRTKNNKRDTSNKVHLNLKLVIPLSFPI